MLWGLGINEKISQIAFADRILINKIDLCSASELDDLETRVMAINNVAPIAKSIRGNIDLNFVLGIDGFKGHPLIENIPSITKISSHLSNVLLLQPS